MTRPQTIRTRTKTKKIKLNTKLPQGDSKLYTVYVFTRIHGGCPVAVGFPFITARSQTADDKFTNNQNPNKNQEDKAAQSSLKLTTRSRTIRTRTKIKKTKLNTKLSQVDDKITNNQNPNKNQEDKAPSS
jgi:hypothetical protein